MSQTVLGDRYSPLQKKFMLHSRVYILLYYNFFEEQLLHHFPQAKRDVLWWNPGNMN